MLRIKQRRLVLALVIFSAVFWCFLYWNLTSFYAYHKSLRAHQDQINEIDIYSELYLENLGKVKTAEDQRKYDAGEHLALKQMTIRITSYLYVI